MGLPIVQGTVPEADDFNLFQPLAHDGANVAVYLDSMRPMTALVQLDEYSGTANCVRMIVSENVLFYKRDDNDITSASNPNGSVCVDQLGRRWKRLQGDVTQAVKEIAAAALGSAQLAETEKQHAQTAKTGAEAARDAASATGKVYATTAAGLALTSSGQYFSVPSPDVTEYLILYLNSAGTAVEQKRYPSTAAVDMLRQVAPTGYAWSVVDQDNLAAIGVKGDGTVKVASLDADLATITSFVLGGLAQEANAQTTYPWSIVDQDDKIAIAVEETGRFLIASAQIDTLNGVPVAQILAGGGSSAVADIGAQNFGSDIAHFIAYGQSLSNGTSAPSVITTAQRFDNLTFSGGVRAQDAGTNPAVKYASFVPLTETLITPSEGYAVAGETFQGESPVAGATDYIKELIASENGIAYTQQSYQLLGSAPGFGGVTIAQLSKGSSVYARLMQDVQYGYALAQAAGKTYMVPCLAWLQGESDAGTAVATYAAALNQLRVDFEADVKAITGQTENVILISYQTGQTGNARMGQLLASETYPNIHIAAPNYFLPKSDGTHFTATSSKIFGAYLGQVYKRVVVDGKAWLPVKPLALYRQGKIINARFSTVKGPLVLDSMTVTGQTNNGFSLVDSVGAAIALSSVTLTGPNTVRIVASTTVPAGARLQYGMTNTFGNLRDSGGLTKIFGGNGLNHPMHNWCVNFDKSIV